MFYILEQVHGTEIIFRPTISLTILLNEKWDVIMLLQW